MQQLHLLLFYKCRSACSDGTVVLQQQLTNAYIHVATQGQQVSSNKLETHAATASSAAVCTARYSSSSGSSCGCTGDISNQSRAPLDADGTVLAAAVVSLHSTIYNMCTQKPPYDYSEQLYQRYKDAFNNYINDMVSCRGLKVNWCEASGSMPYPVTRHILHLLRRFHTLKLAHAVALVKSWKAVV